MKRKTNKLLAALLAAIIVFGTAVSVSAYASDKSPDTGVETFEDQAPLGDPAEEVTTEAPTEEPTQAPTEEPAPEVGAVTGLKKTSLLTNELDFSWNPVAGASGYAVYYRNVDRNCRTVKLGDVTATSYKAKNMKTGELYELKVAAYIIRNGIRYDGPVTMITTATQPAKISALNRVATSNVIKLSWNKVPLVTGYKVLRKSAESGNKEVLYKVLSGNNNVTFTDSKVKYGYTYVYRIVPIRHVNGATFHASGTGITCMPGLHTADFSVKTEFYRGFLSWNKNKYATRYDVYYAITPNAAKYTYVGTTTGTSYMTGKLPGGRNLYFRVYPIYKKNSSSAAITGTTATKSAYTSPYMYGNKVGSTYIEINIKRQHMWFYKSGKLVVDTPVVTGNNDGECNTPQGYFSIFQRARGTTLVGPGYASYVDYWMAFYGGCGIHDASWRSSFGGNIYNGNGSHGCVNTPYYAVQKIYNNSSYGTPVIIYYA